MLDLKRMLTFCTAAAVLVPIGASAEQLAKRGTYSGIYGWFFTGRNVEVEKDRGLWGGTATGAFRNDSGGGFLHTAEVVCTSAGEFRKDAVIHDGGDCVATDKDGDKAVFTWKCTQCPEVGEFEWTGGTGKYAGLKGHNTFRQTNAGGPDAVSGWSTWKGEWTLP